MALSLALTALLALQTEPLKYDPEAKVTLNISAERLPTIVSQINQQLGTELLVNPQFVNEVFVVRVKERRLGDVMDAIADVTDGEWLPSGRLTTDGAASARREKARQDRIAKELTKMVDKARETFQKNGGVSADKLRARINAAPPAPGTETNWQDYMQNNLGALLGNEVAPHLPINRIAALKQGERLVLSTNPTALQAPMPGGMVQAFRRAFSEIAKINPGDIRTPEAGQPMDYSLVELRRSASLLRSRSIQNLLMIVQLQSWGMNVMPMIQVKALDADGRPIFETQVSLFQSFEDQSKEWESLQQNNSAELETQKPLSMSEESKLFARLLTQGSPYMNMDAMDRKPVDLNANPKLLEYLLRPDENEPLRFGFGQLIGEALERTNSEGVFLLDDLMFSPAMGGPEAMPPMGPKQLLMIFERFGMMHEEKGLKRTMIDSPSTRVNRTALGKAGGQIRKERVFTWENAITYARSIQGEANREGFGMNFDMTYLGVLGGLPETVQEVFQHMLFLRWLGNLPQTSLNQLLGGGQLVLGTLQPDSQAEFRRMVLAGSMPLRNPAWDQELAEGMTAAAQAGNAEGGDWVEQAIEPTTVFANGVPRQATITLKRNVSNVVMAITETGAATVAQPSQLGFMMNLAKRPGEQMRFYQRFANLKEFRVGKREEMEFTIQYGGNITTNLSIPFHRFDFSQPMVSMDNLPADVLKEIKSGMEMEFEEGPSTGPDVAPPIAQ